MASCFLHIHRWRHGIILPPGLFFAHDDSRWRIVRHHTRPCVLFLGWQAGEVDEHAKKEAMAIEAGFNQSSDSDDSDDNMKGAKDFDARSVASTATSNITVMCCASTSPYYLYKGHCLQSAVTMLVVGALRVVYGCCHSVHTRSSEIRCCTREAMPCVLFDGMVLLLCTRTHARL